MQIQKKVLAKAETIKKLYEQNLTLGEISKEVGSAPLTIKQVLLHIYNIVTIKNTLLK